MTVYEIPLAFRQALDARLRNDAADAGSTIERVRQLIVFDRFLARVRTDLGDRVIVKGGVVMELRLERARTTRDIDLKWTGDASAVLDALRTASALDLGDFMEFTVLADKKHPVLRAEGMQYDGARFAVNPTLGGKQYGLPFGVDVAVGDVLLEPPEEIEGPATLAFLGLPRTKHRVYPRTSHVAEKLHAYTLPRTRENSRLKDLPDIALLATTGAFDAAKLRAAIDATFRARAVHEAPKALPAPLPSWAAPYARMAKSDGLPWTTLDVVYGAAKKFIDPVLSDEAMTWSPAVWKWR